MPAVWSGHLQDDGGWDSITSSSLINQPQDAP